jgi:hypothetical protein
MTVKTYCGRVAARNAFSCYWQEISLSLGKEKREVLGRTDHLLEYLI